MTQTKLSLFMAGFYNAEMWDKRWGGLGNMPGYLLAEKDVSTDPFWAGYRHYLASRK